MKRHGDLPMLIEHGLDLDTLVFGSQKNETNNHDNDTTTALRFVHGTTVPVLAVVSNRVILK